MVVLHAVDPQATTPESDTTDALEASRRLGVSRKTFYQMALRGEIPVIRIGGTGGRGGRVRVSRAALDRILERGTV